MKPKRGETAFEVTRPIVTPPSTGTEDSGCGVGCGGLLALLLFLGVCSIIIEENSTPTFSAASSYTSSIAAPNPPAGRYATFTQSDPSESARHHTVTFQNERIEVIRVGALGDIPPEVRAVANVPSDASPSTTARPGPYILTGNVGITLGPLRAYDKWAGTVIASDGQIKRVDSVVDLHDYSLRNSDLSRPAVESGAKTEVAALVAALSARGPPDGLARRVYIVGEVTSVNSPTLSQHSEGSLGVLDLRPTSEEYARYQRDVIVYQERVTQERIMHERMAEVTRAREAASRASRPRGRAGR